MQQNLKLTLIEKVIRPDYVTSDNYHSHAYLIGFDKELAAKIKDYTKHVDKLIDQCDIAKAILGEEPYWTAHTNLKGGRCECCGDFDTTNITQWEFYKIEKNI